MHASYDFTNVVDRLGTHSVKWRIRETKDVIPLGVADMDFKAPPEVMQALEHRVRHGIYGYTLPWKELENTIVAMLAEKYSWEIEPGWIVWLPNLVSGLNVSCRAVGDRGDIVLTSVPVYPPFLAAPKNVERRLATIPLIQTGERCEMNLDAITDAISDRTRLYMLCNPHNPVGRAFSKDELEGLAEICMRHNLIICADEIHCDFILDPEHSHTPLASLDREIAAHSITLMAPSKTFNLAGLGCGFAIIPDRELRLAFQHARAGLVPMPAVLGLTACQAAYQHGGPWLEALLKTLRSNRDLVTKAVDEIPLLHMNPVEATYLAWIDTRPAELEDPVAFFVEYGLDLWDGANFDGPGFVRLNFALPESVLREGLSRLKRAGQHLAHVKADR
jgi:cystathionine beta-lyase